MTRPKHPFVPQPRSLYLAVAAALGLVSCQAFSQAIPVPGNATATTAPNGVPLVNIVAPNSGGLSHNQYTALSVGANGMVLNNATAAAQTKLAGAISPNGNLGGRAASLILNEVVGGGQPSNLAGYLEVGGTAAEVVVANPYGIACSGCGFINTPRVTLTTGVPNITASGSLTGFSVYPGSGMVLIDIGGLDGSAQNYFDVISRAIQVNGQRDVQPQIPRGWCCVDRRCRHDRNERRRCRHLDCRRETHQRLVSLLAVQADPGMDQIGIHAMVTYASLAMLATLAWEDPWMIARVLASIGLASTFYMLYYLRSERSWEFLYGIVYAYFSFFTMLWIFLTAVMTVRSRSWLTR
jgi:filamentous hemagglutinin family protein